ncbi:MAG: hypothetical protein ABIU63_17420 [Chitinophagaceae bacterium]
MILTHPYIFNTIVILFIAFTSGWLVFVLLGRSKQRLKNKMDELEKEKEQLEQHAQQLEDQLQGRYPNSIKNTPVIAISSTVKGAKTRDTGR